MPLCKGAVINIRCKGFDSNASVRCYLFMQVLVAWIDKMELFALLNSIEHSLVLQTRI